MRWWLSLTLLTLSMALPARAQAPLCDGRTEHKLNQEYYLTLTDRVAVWAPDINSSGTTNWEAFTLKVVSGKYRKPFLLGSALLKERDLAKALSGRPDVVQTPIAVPASKSLKPGMALGAATVQDGERSAKVTIRVTRVVPVQGFRSVDHAFLVCSVGR